MLAFVCQLMCQEKECATKGVLAERGRLPLSSLLMAINHLGILPISSSVRAGRKERRSLQPPTNSPYTKLLPLLALVGVHFPDIITLALEKTGRDKEASYIF